MPVGCGDHSSLRAPTPEGTRRRPDIRMVLRGGTLEALSGPERLLDPLLGGDIEECRRLDLPLTFETPVVQDLSFDPLRFCSISQRLHQMKSCPQGR